MADFDISGLIEVVLMDKMTLIVSAFLVFVTLIGSPTNAGEGNYNYREQNGAANVIWMNGLLEDYEAERISEADLMRELWFEQPLLMAALYDFYGQFTECFKIDLITGQTNGVKFTQNGTRVFYDTSVYLDGNGQVIAGQERAYNNAVRANSILNDAADWNEGNCQAVWMNNHCCHENGLGIECLPQNQKRCKVPNPQLLNCDQNNGNPC